MSKRKRSQVSASYTPLTFIDFVRERQAVFERRSRGLPRHQWTSDEVLRLGRFCNIDRRDDRVTRELLHCLQGLGTAASGLRRRVLLATALRFTSSRRGEAAKLARLVVSHDDGAGGAKQRGRTALASALLKGTVRCGKGTYQMTLSFKELSRKIDAAVDAVLGRVAAGGPFPHVAAAADFLARRMTVRRRRRGYRPQFAANETAKDFLYIPGLLRPDAAEHCPLGRGARRGLTAVARAEPGLRRLGTGAAVRALRGRLCGGRSGSGAGLAWIRPVDVEQALCEYHKYTRYFRGGVRRPFEPSPLAMASLRRPRAGRPAGGLCAAAGGALGKEIHPSHALRRKRAITWCVACGCWTGTRRFKKLAEACEGTPNAAGREVLRLLPKRYPKYGKDWPEADRIELKTGTRASWRVR